MSPRSTSPGIASQPLIPMTYPHASNADRGRTDAWTDRNRVLTISRPGKRPRPLDWPVRPAWTLRQTTGEPSGLYEARGGRSGGDTRNADLVIGVHQGGEGSERSL